MTQELIDLRDKLKYIREYIVKLNVEQRKSRLALEKFVEAQTAYCKLENIVSRVEISLKNTQVSDQEIELIQNRVDEIKDLFRRIRSYFYVESSSQTSFKVPSTKMTTEFDLKTALALLPMMNGQEQVTSQLLDGIKLYSNMLDEDSVSKLIDFVLKTRLSANAKLRLKSSYPTIDSLISDMQKYLIQKKSAVAILSKLHSVEQGNRSIDNFGSELESLFVNLTLSQADGDSEKFNVLRPINEKIAIKRFADGLRDSRLSTIVASRQFESLPEAIRTAVDEQSMSHNYDQAIFNVRRDENYQRKPQRQFHNRRGNYFNFRGNSQYRGNYNSKNNYYYKPFTSNARNPSPASNYNRSRGRGRGAGSHVHYGTRQHYNSNNVSQRDSSRPVQHAVGNECTRNAPDSEFFRPFNQ